MNFLKLTHSFFKLWITSVNKSNYFETLVALEAPSSSLKAKRLGINKENQCCES